MQKVYLQNKFFNNWWRSIDRKVLICIFFLIIIGGLISFAATPAVAQKYNLDPNFFVKKQVSLVFGAVFNDIFLFFPFFLYVFLNVRHFST